MPSALTPLLLALATSAGGEPAVVSAPASPTSPAALTTRCAPLGKAGDDIECVVQQARPSATPAPLLRVRVTTAPAACRALDAQTVAPPAAATGKPAPAGSLPVVVQDGPNDGCAR